MRSSGYWRWKAEQKIALLEAHSAKYHESIFDIPKYIEMLFYVAMALIAPDRKKLETKD